MVQTKRVQNRSPRRSNRQRHGGTPNNDGSFVDAQSTMGNAAARELIEQAQATDTEQLVDGPMGRVFNRILGVEENRNDTGQASFTVEALEDYLEHTLSFARDEWFRGKKISGAAEALMGELDSGGDGQVDWLEFQDFRAQTLSSLAPDSKMGDDAASVTASARTNFSEMDSGREPGALGFSEIQNGARAALPQGTEHLDLVSQLAARIALDAVDTDQRELPIERRTLSQEEWESAARQMAGAGS